MKAPARVQYRERQRLRAEDLQAEQDYLLGLAGRHHIGPHGWGIVRGLSIALEDGIATIRPGLAIDGYGRELVVYEPVRLELDPNVLNQSVYLYYCERPQGGCGDANPRWRDSAEINLTPEPWPLSEEEPELTVGRAAGVVPEAPPWPVLLGNIKRGNANEFSVDLSESRFTRFRSGPVRPPSGRTFMRLGQENLADPYHFRVSAQDAGNATQNRFAIDRDGNPAFWEDLVITGWARSVNIPSPINGVSIQAQLKAGLGADVRWRTTVEIIDGQPFLKLSFRAKTAEGQVIEENLLVDKSIKRVRDLNAQLKEFNARSELISLVKTGKILKPQGLNALASDSSTSITSAATAPTANQTRNDRPTPIEYEAGVIGFKREVKPESDEFCGCREGNEKPSALPEGLVFQPGQAPPTVPSKDIYCIRVSEPTQAPVEHLRIVGGPSKKGDLKRRVLIGDSNKVGNDYVFRPWLAVRGNGSIEIPGGQLDANGNAFTMLAVTGTVELPPIKPDPRDPLFNALSVLAFINGVLSLSSALLKLTFTNLPTFVETEQDWSYGIRVENMTTQPLTPTLNTSEIITAGTRSFLRSVQNIPNIGPRQATTVQVPHQRADIPIDAQTSELTLDVRIVMSATEFKVAGAQKVSIPVIQSPLIDLIQIPPAVPNANLPDDFPINITNRSGQRVTILTAHVIGGAIQLLQPLPQDIDPTQSISAEVTIPHQANTGRHTLTVRITYRWTADVFSIERSAEIEIT